MIQVLFELRYKSRSLSVPQWTLLNLRWSLNHSPLHLQCGHNFVIPSEIQEVWHCRRDKEETMDDQDKYEQHTAVEMSFTSSTIVSLLRIYRMSLDFRTVSCSFLPPLLVQWASAPNVNIPYPASLYLSQCVAFLPGILSNLSNRWREEEGMATCVCAGTVGGPFINRWAGFKILKGSNHKSYNRLLFNSK